MTPRCIAASAVTMALVASASGAQIVEIIDAAGDGTGNTLDGASSVAVYGSGSVYLSGQVSKNAFMIETLIFADGFESGDTSAWSNTVP